MKVFEVEVIVYLMYLVFEVILNEFLSMIKIGYIFKNDFCFWIILFMYVRKYIDLSMFVEFLVFDLKLWKLG